MSESTPSQPVFQAQDQPLEAIGPFRLPATPSLAARPPAAPLLTLLVESPSPILRRPDALPDPEPTSNRRYHRTARLAVVFVSIVGNWCVVVALVAYVGSSLALRVGLTDLPTSLRAHAGPRRRPSSPSSHLAA